MKIDNPARRVVLETIGKASLLGFGGFALGGCESILEKIRGRPM